MVVRNRTATNGAGAGAQQTEAVTPTLQLEPEATAQTEDEQGCVIGETAVEPTEESETELQVGSEADFETDFGNSNAAVDSTTNALLELTPLSRQDAIAQVNASNHDLIGLLEPLLSAAPTQKRLAEMFARQVNLSDVGAAAWLLNVKELLEKKKQASQSLIRSLIAEA